MKQCINKVSHFIQSISITLSHMYVPTQRSQTVQKHKTGDGRQLSKQLNWKRTKTFERPNTAATDHTSLPKSNVG